MPDFRRGAEAAAAATKRTGGGNSRQFTPELFWKSDGDDKYLLFLNAMADIPTVDAISFIPQEGKKADGERFTYYERVIARTDPAIGEDSDPMADEWDGKPRATCIAVAVELEPTLEEVRGRMRPTGFQVKTTSYERRVRDEDGELTDDYEEVETPAIGFIHASPHNFFNVVTSFDADTAPIEDTPVKITRVGNGTSTVYRVDGFEDIDLDLSALIDFLDGVSYLGDELDDLLDEVDNIEDEREAALLIGNTLLDKRLEELADPDRYDTLLKSITKSLDPFSGKDKKGKSSRKTAAKRERPARRSSRRAKDPEPELEDVSAGRDDPEPESEEPKEEAKAPRRRRAKKEEAPETQPEPSEEPKASARQEASREKLNALRNRQAKRKSAA